MIKKNGVSKKSMTVIENVWVVVSLIILLKLQENLNLNFWTYLCLGVSISMLGVTLIKKIIKVNE